MVGILRVAATGVVVAGTWFTLPGRAAVIPDSLTVRIYDNSGILAGDRARAILRAREVLSRAGLDLEFRDCPPAKPQAPASCAAPPSVGELIVRLARGDTVAGSGRHGSSPAASALGSSLIDTVTGKGTLATVFVDRIKAMAHHARADQWVMTGRVMAHEIGHLLLGTGAHSKTGLMRELWTAAELTRNRAQDWMFSSAQRQTLRDAQLLGRRETTAALGGASGSGGASGEDGRVRQAGG